MITFSCKKCGKFLGELSKGRLKRGTVLICTECYKIIEKKDAAQKLSDLGTADGCKEDFMGMFNDLFKNASKN